MLVKHTCATSPWHEFIKPSPRTKKSKSQGCPRSGSPMMCPWRVNKIKTGFSPEGTSIYALHANTCWTTVDQPRERASMTPGEGSLLWKGENYHLLAASVAHSCRPCVASFVWSFCVISTQSNTRTCSQRIQGLEITTQAEERVWTIGMRVL